MPVFKNINAYVQSRLGNIEIGTNSETIITGKTLVRGDMIVQTDLLVEGEAEVKQDVTCNGEFIEQ